MPPPDDEEEGGWVMVLWDTGSRDEYRFCYKETTYHEDMASSHRLTWDVKVVANRVPQFKAGKPNTLPRGIDGTCAICMEPSRVRPHLCGVLTCPGGGCCADCLSEMFKIEVQGYLHRH